MPPQFLVVGHAVQDLISEDEPTAWRLGGAASYASALASNLGLETAVLTAAAPDFDLPRLLPGVACHVVASDHNTQIRNVYDGGRRHQYLPQRATLLSASHVPGEWRDSQVVLLGPVAGEIDASLAACFPHSLVGAGAQGWLREVDSEWRVRPLPPERWDASPILRHARALFLSDEDVPPASAPAALRGWAAMVEIVAFTRGYNGADVCRNGEWRHIEPFPAEAVDPTGAGDIFAAAFLIRLHETGDVWEATRFAGCAASFVVEGEGISAVPDGRQIEERLRANPAVVARPGSLPDPLHDLRFNVQ
jgi:sugar/nucleoside kinase (ribokinase family)